MARERCIRRTAQYNRLWEVGEIRTIENFNEEGKAIVSDHFVEVKKDETFDPNKAYDQEDVKKRQAETQVRDKTSAIINALRKLDADDDANWTVNGYPSVQKVHILTDFEVTRADIQAAAPDFDRKSWAETQQAEAEQTDRRL